MKNTDIYIIVILFILFVVFFRKSVKLERQNENLKNELFQVRKDFREHLEKCSFININSIQKISADGRFITLYHPAQIIRKKRYEIHYIKK